MYLSSFNGGKLAAPIRFGARVLIRLRITRRFENRKEPDEMRSHAQTDVQPLEGGGVL